jgi:hypothetical protein
MASSPTESGTNEGLGGSLECCRGSWGGCLAGACRPPPVNALSTANGRTAPVPRRIQPAWAPRCQSGPVSTAANSAARPGRGPPGGNDLVRSASDRWRHGGDNSADPFVTTSDRTAFYAVATDSIIGRTPNTRLRKAAAARHDPRVGGAPPRDWSVLLGPSWATQAKQGAPSARKEPRGQTRIPPVCCLAVFRPGEDAGDVTENEGVRTASRQISGRLQARPGAARICPIQRRWSHVRVEHHAHRRWGESQRDRARWRERRTSVAPTSCRDWGTHTTAAGVFPVMPTTRHDA